MNNDALDCTCSAGLVEKSCNCCINKTHGWDHERLSTSHGIRWPQFIFSAQMGYLMVYQLNCRHLVKHKYKKQRNNSNKTQTNKLTYTHLYRTLWSAYTCDCDVRPCRCLHKPIILLFIIPAIKLVDIQTLVWSF